MNSVYFHLSPYFISLAITLAVAAYAWRKRRNPGVKYYAGLALGQSLWTLGYIFELTSATQERMTFWDDFQWLGANLMLVWILPFTLHFSGSRLAKYKAIHWFTTVPAAAFLLLVATNGWHGLTRGAAWVVPGTPFPMLEYEFTPLVWLWAGYTYLVMLASSIILAVRYTQSQAVYRSQILTVLAGILVMLAGGLLTLLGISFAPQRDMSPLTFALADLIILWGLWEYRLFDLLPVAAEAVLRTMSDPVVIVDRQNRVVELNPAAEELFGMASRDAVGREPEEAFPAWRAVAEDVRQVAEGRGEGEIEAEVGGMRRTFALRVSPIEDHQGQGIGRAYVARDITALKLSERELSRLNDQLEMRVLLRTQELAKAYDTTLEGWARALELRDKETEGHSRRVTKLAVRLAMALELDGEALTDIHRGALLHDIGKMGIPDEILRKPGELTEEEREVVHRHPALAYNLLAGIPFLSGALDIPYCHHEKWDGSGYPRGLRGEEIPLAARIFTVVDVWDALRSERPYGAASRTGEAAEYIRAEAGRHFDPAVAAKFLELVERGEVR